MNTSGTHTSSVVVLPDVSGLTDVTDEELLELQRESGSARRRVDAVVAAISGELARRSDRSLGHSGLAARTGAATPEKAVQLLTGVSLSEAKALVAVGSVTPESPWLAPVSDALDSGELSVAAAAAITRGLGTPSADVASDDLLDAAASLVDFAREASPESTGVAARQLRERLDVSSVADLEALRRGERSLTYSTLRNGNVRIVIVSDPESSAIILGGIEAIVSPRRGGPRFVDPAEQERAKKLSADDRTLPQLCHDALVDIIKLANRAAEGDVSTLFGVRSPAVRVHVQASDLQSGEGFAYIEGPDRIRQHRDRQTPRLRVRMVACPLRRRQTNRRRGDTEAPQSTTTSRRSRLLERMPVGRLRSSTRNDRDAPHGQVERQQHHPCQEHHAVPIPPYGVTRERLDHPRTGRRTDREIDHRAGSAIASA